MPELMQHPVARTRGRAPVWRLGASPIFHGRGELLALVYGIGGAGALGVWAVDPGDVRSGLGMAVLVVFVGAVAASAYLLRRRLPPGSEDVGVVGSLALISVAVALTRYRVHPELFAPYYVWVGFASPMWFPLRRAVVYLVLTVAVCGVMMVVAHTAVAAAAWCVVTATCLVAFLIVHLLGRSLIRTERLAAVGQMTASVGHELRNPLAALTNALYLVRAHLGADISPELDEHLAVAERQVGRAAALADDMTAFVRPRPPTFEDVALPALVAEVLGTVRPPAGIDVVRQIDAVTVRADRGQLGALLTNLLVNAYDAMGGRGVLVVGVHADDHHVDLVVEDSGHGIEEALLAHIFEPFATTKTRGTGLGLAIVRRIVDDHGGKVTCQSHPGRGTRMTVRLPLVP